MHSECSQNSFPKQNKFPTHLESQPQLSLSLQWFDQNDGFIVFFKKH